MDKYGFCDMYENELKHKVEVNNMCEEKKNAGEEAFSLAEAMVVLVIVSIIMALSAPLIAKRATANQNRLVIGNGAEVLTAQGNNQNFIVGTSDYQDKDKLTVKGKSKFNGTAEFNNNGSSADTVVFQIKPSTDNNVTKRYTDGFVVYADGSINQGRCLPASNSQQFTSGSMVASDGYIISNTAVTIGGGTFYPQVAVACADGSCSASFAGDVKVPVVKGETVSFANSPTISTASGNLAVTQPASPTINFYSCQR